jgi:5-carboxymethyl-2-hydroxymuconate isomerase
MPHLQFDINKKLDEGVKQKFISFVEHSFSEIMETGTDHIAISIREQEKSNLSLGRANKNEDICLMNLDIRSGRKKKQVEKLIKTLMVGVDKIFKIKVSNQYTTITNHPGDEFNLFEKSLSNWKANDDPTNQ